MDGSERHFGFGRFQSAGFREKFVTLSSFGYISGLPAAGIFLRGRPDQGKRWMSPLEAACKC
jgi:hypothetical protein